MHPPAPPHTPGAHVSKLSRIINIISLSELNFYFIFLMDIPKPNLKPKNNLR